MKKSYITTLGLVFSVVLLTSGTKEVKSNNGITGQTTAGCTCHGSQSGTVTLSGIPATTLKSTAYTFSITYTPTTSYKYFGLDVKASSGTLTAGTGMKKSGTEVTHSAPFGGTTAASYTFAGIGWTAPATAGTTTFTYACVAGTSTGSTSGPWQKGSFATSVVLPVELASFGATKQSNNNVLISWKTSIEINTSYFEVEKSKDAKTFTAFAKVAASGNSNVAKSYSVNDIADNNTTATYYRIKIVDKNGETSYSNIQSINTKVNTTLNTVYPNPAKKGQDVNVELNSDKEQSITFVLVNQQGQIVSSKIKNIQQGYNKVNLQFGNYIAAGNYYLQAKVNNGLLSPVNISIIE